MSGLNPFTRQGSTVSIAATVASANTAIVLGAQTRQILVTNAGTTVVFVTFGTSGALTATSAGTPILGGSKLMLSVPVETTFVAAIAASGTPTVYFTPGIGE